MENICRIFYSNKYTYQHSAQFLLQNEFPKIDVCIKYLFFFCYRNLEDYSREHEEASRNIQEHLSNPINAYLLVKRLTSDWKRVEKLITNDVWDSFLANISNSRSDLKFPTEEDLNGAAVALIRLQDTYKLETAQVARGVLNGIQYSTGLSGQNFIIIEHFFNQYYCANYFLSLNLKKKPKLFRSEIIALKAMGFYKISHPCSGIFYVIFMIYSTRRKF